MLSGSWDPLPALSGHVRCKATAPASSRARAKDLTTKCLRLQAELSFEPPVLTEAEFDELFGSTSDLNELLVTQLHGVGGGRDGGDGSGGQRQMHSAPPDSRQTLAALIAQAKQPVSLPDVDVPRSDPVQARVAVAVACLRQLSLTTSDSLLSPAVGSTCWLVVWRTLGRCAAVEASIRVRRAGCCC